MTSQTTIAPAVTARIQATTPFDIEGLMRSDGLSRIEDLTRREFISGALAAAFLIACGGDGDDDDNNGGGTRQIDDAFGVITIPLKPRRIVAINVITIEAAALAGAERLLAYGDGAMNAYKDLYAGLTESTVIDAFEPDVERIAQLQPDLILDGAWEGGLFSGVDRDALMRIAPVAAFDFTSDLGWKEYYAFYADAVDESAAGAGVLKAYEDRVARLRTLLGRAEAVAGISVSSLIVRSAAEIQDYRKDSFSARILDDIGFGAPETSEDFSFERLQEADADYVIAWFGGSDPAELQANLASPLWQQLEATRNDRLFSFGDHWFGFGPLSADMVLDDLDGIFAVDSKS